MKWRGKLWWLKRVVLEAKETSIPLEDWQQMECSGRGWVSAPFVVSRACCVTLMATRVGKAPAWVFTCCFVLNLSLAHVPLLFNFLHHVTHLVLHREHLWRELRYMLFPHMGSRSHVVCPSVRDLSCVCSLNASQGKHIYCLHSPEMSSH